MSPRARRAAALAAALAGLAFGAAPASAGTPTCSDVMGIAVHGQHIIGDYVTGLGGMTMGWPPAGGVVGAAVSANGGVTIAGGPGPGFHFPNGFAPGASFCTSRSSSPGFHF